MNNEIISIQIELIKKSTEILENRISEIEFIQRSKKYKSQSDSERDSVIAVFKVRSLKLYKRTLNYIYKELKREDDISVFLLPQCRTLIDIYSRFLYLLIKNNNDNERALTCITYQLRTYLFLKNEKTYNDTIKLYENFIKEINYQYPEYHKFSKNWCKNKTFRDMDKIITKENITKYSVDVLDVYKGESTYNIYSGFSENLHGNPYHLGEFGTEKFWVITMSMAITAFLIEIVDIYTLKKSKKKDFIKWLKEIKKTQGNFVSVWISKKNTKN